METKREKRKQHTIIDERAEEDLLQSQTYNPCQSFGMREPLAKKQELQVEQIESESDILKGCE